MGYRPQRKRYELVFQDMPGLEVTVKSASIGELREIEELNNTQDRLALFRVFADKLISWNMEDPESGEPMPPTLDSILALEVETIMPIIVGWVQTVARVAAPKGLNLPAGVNNTLSDNAMRTLETLQNPGTFPTPNLS